ncbi:hypothetical protein PENTCL1PPCAC_16534, partial [Pristionchus entomophagus]
SPKSLTMDMVTDAALAIVHLLVTVTHCLVLTIIDIVKACLPIGVLPRKSIKGDICLITGSGSGLGRLMALEFAKHGCDIVLWDVNTAGNDETKKMLGSSGARVWSYTVDLSDRKDIAAKADLVKKEVGNIDILINNAGIVTGKKIFECPDELMEKTMAVNCMACLYTTKHFAKSMIDRNHGHIVTIASIAGKLGVAGLVDYCASKHGAVGFHESMSYELRILKADGVKTSLICPYYINTGMFDGVVTNAPLILPILDPKYAIECIMEAVLTNKENYFIPRFLYICTTFLALFPTKANSLMNNYFKIAETMDDFKGRQPVKH